MLEKELKNKVYQINNLDKHINNFINVQIMETTQQNYKILLDKFYNYCIENQLKEININNCQNIIKE